MKNIIMHAVDYLKDTDVDIRIRLLYLVEYAALCACLIGTLTMFLFATDVIMLFPNLILFLFCMSGLWVGHYKKNYTLATNLCIVGCAFISLPFMYFLAGGNNSGMIIWFLFATIFCCVISTGKSRIIMPPIMIIISSVIMLIGHYYPDCVVRLENESAEFFDTFQSYIVVSVMLFVTLCVYLYTYDRQSKMLEMQREELRKMVYTDSLTGIANRHAYYEAINEYREITYCQNLVVLALDVNGLKSVNDNEGHAAGDTLIKSAAIIIDSTFNKLGTVYRTGGDEFMAILTCEDQEIDRLKELLDEAVLAAGDEMQNMSIAMGVAAWNQEKGKTFFELEKLADRRMYKNKSEFYQKSGIERRKEN